MTIPPESAISTAVAHANDVFPNPPLPVKKNIGC